MWGSPYMSRGSQLVYGSVLFVHKEAVLSCDTLGIKWSRQLDLKVHGATATYTNTCSTYANVQLKPVVDNQVLKNLPCRFFEGEPEK